MDPFLRYDRNLCMLNASALEGDAWTFEHEYDYKQLLKQHESLQDRTGERA